LQDFRNRTFGGGAGVEGGESANNLLAQRVIRQFEEAQAASERFVASFREGVGAIWDGFFVRGQGVLSSLANFAKGLLNSVGRTLFQNFATGLFTGGSGGGRGLASVAGNLGGGLGLSKIFGGAGGGLLGGLFGGGAAASSVPLAAIQGGFVPALPLSAIGGGVGAAAGGGGLAGALGFGGGAGLLGLGAATIPVFGGIALGAGLLLKHFLKGQPEAAFTRDPSEQRSVEYFFNTLPAVLGGVRDALDDFRNTYRPMSASQVLVAGMPGALQSSNQFRRNTMSILSDDL
jgi:hypothetical protein